MTALLEIHDLRKFFETRRGPFGAEISVVRAVDGVSFTVERGEAFGWRIRLREINGRATGLAADRPG